eukprot:gene341-353_t
MSDAVLIEFFGTHDFGWVRMDNLEEFTADGQLPSSFTKRATGYGNCSAGSVREAIQSLGLLNAADNMPDDPPPLYEDLERALDDLQQNLDAKQASNPPLSHLSAGAPLDRYGYDADEGLQSTEQTAVSRGGPSNVGKGAAKTSDQKRPDSPFVALAKVFSKEFPAHLSLKERALVRTRLYSSCLSFGPVGLPKALGAGASSSLQSAHGAFTAPIVSASSGPENLRKRSPSLLEEDQDGGSMAGEGVLTAGHGLAGALNSSRASSRPAADGKDSYLFTVGCTSYGCGESVVHGRKVDLRANVLYLEGRKCERRKKVLKSQIAQLQKEIQTLQSASANLALDMASKSMLTERKINGAMGATVAVDKDRLFKAKVSSKPPLPPHLDLDRRDVNAAVDG